MTITPDPIKDQFFLEDTSVIDKMIAAADLSSKDLVIEIGAGTGNITRKIASKADQIVAFEIDEKFKSALKSLPKNVEVRFEKAEIPKNFRDKIIANPPFSLIEPLLHSLTLLDYKKVILLVPKKTLKTIKTSEIFSSFFNPKILFEVPKTSFNPVPKTNCVVIDLLKLPDPIMTKNRDLFLRRYVYKHKKQLLKNSLMEGIIRYEKRVNNKFVTKNEARKEISELHL